MCFGYFFQNFKVNYSSCSKVMNFCGRGIMAPILNRVEENMFVLGDFAIIWFVFGGFSIILLVVM